MHGPVPQGHAETGEEKEYLPTAERQTAEPAQQGEGDENEQLPDESRKDGPAVAVQQAPDDSLELSGTSLGGELSQDSFLFCALPRGERAEVSMPPLVPDADGEEDQPRMLVPTSLDGIYPRKHFVQFLPMASKDTPSAHLEVDLPSKLTEVSHVATPLAF